MKNLIKYTLVFVFGFALGIASLYAVVENTYQHSLANIAESDAINLKMIREKKYFMLENILSVLAKVAINRLEDQIESSLFTSCDDLTKKVISENKEYVENKAICD